MQYSEKHKLKIKGGKKKEDDENEDDDDDAEDEVGTIMSSTLFLLGICR